MPHITINNRSMHYLDVGQGEPILFGHSYLWDRHMWQAQVDALSKNYRCIVPDLWGHGDSGAVPEGELSIQSLANDYFTLMQELGIEKFSLVGLSVGGMWAARMAMDHPEAINRLVMMDTFLGDEPTQTQQMYFGMLDMVEQVGTMPPPLVDKLLPIFLSTTTLNEQPQIVEQFAADLTAIPTENIPAVVALGRMIFSRPNMLEELAKLSMPVLVMCGEQDRPRPAHEAKAMADIIPGAQFEIITNAGHIPPVEQPLRVNEQLLAFFANA